MSTDTINYYFQTTSMQIFQIKGLCLLDMENGESFTFDGKLTSNYLKIPEGQLRNILYITKMERLYAIMMMINLPKNIYNPKSTNTKFLSSVNNLLYYLIPNQYGAWKSGSIFVVNDKTFYDFDIKNGGVIGGSFPKDWIMISDSHKTILNGKKRTNRVAFYHKSLKNSAIGVTTYTSSRFRIQTTSKLDVTRSLSQPPTSLLNSLALTPKTEFFESVVIIPSSVVEVKMAFFKNWTIGDTVSFTLIDSGFKYEGTLKWMGLINGINSAAISLASLKGTDSLMAYRSSTQLNTRFYLVGYTYIILVRLSALHKTLSQAHLMEKFFLKMFACLGDSTLAAQIFADAEQLNDAGFVISLINHCPPSFVGDLCLKLINTPNKDNVSYISNTKKLINQIPLSQNDTFLKLAKASALLKYEDLFSLIIVKCTDSNVYLNNGETFLTDIIKSGVEEDIINKVLMKRTFNVDKPNRVNETPLTLACARLLVQSVRLLIRYNCNIDHNNGKALELVFAAKTTANNMEQMTKVIEIIEMLTTATKPEINICTICMDGKINIVFNCGHNACQKCAEKIVICHFCKVTIVNRIPLFLS